MADIRRKYELQELADKYKIEVFGLNDLINDEEFENTIYSIEEAYKTGQFNDRKFRHVIITLYVPTTENGIQQLENFYEDKRVKLYAIDYDFTTDYLSLNKVFIEEGLVEKVKYVEIEN